MLCMLLNVLMSLPYGSSVVYASECSNVSTLWFHGWDVIVVFPGRTCLPF